MLLDRRYQTDFRTVDLKKSKLGLVNIFNNQYLIIKLLILQKYEYSAPFVVDDTLLYTV